MFAGLRDVLTEKAFVLSALSRVCQQSIHLVPCVAESGLRLLLRLSRMIYTIRVVHANTIDLFGAFVDTGIDMVRAR